MPQDPRARANPAQGVEFVRQELHLASSSLGDLQAMARSGWGAIVKSEKLDDWLDALQNFDLWIEVQPEGNVLRSVLFDKLKSAEFVRDRAIILIEQLNGAMAASRGAKPIKFDAVIQFTPDGKQHRFLFPETAMLSLTGLRANAIVIGPDSKPKPAPLPGPSEAQNWINIANNDDLLADALIYFGRATDWFDIYKTLECLILRFGGNETEFFKLNWAPVAEIGRLKQTASWHRHARRKFDSPKDPMRIADAQELIAKLLTRVCRG